MFNAFVAFFIVNDARVSHFSNNKRVIVGIIDVCDENGTDGGVNWTYIPMPVLNIRLTRTLQLNSITH